MAGNPRWQGFPPTVQRGESVGIFLRFRDPTWMHKKMALWHGGNSVVGLYLAYEYWFHGLRGWQLIGGVLAAWCVLWWLAVSRLTWCRREIWFTPREILYRRGNRLKWHRFNRYLPHGFRMERFHLPQKPGEAPLREEAYHLFFDHLQGAIWIGDLWINGKENFY